MSDEHQSASHGHRPATAPVDFWEERYAGSGPVWSGRVNPTMADVASTLRAGSALDLGCGEGGDAIWLAQHGWRVTGLDISPTAIGRAREAAADAGLGEDAVRFEATDLSSWATGSGASLDLVTASFFHSPVALPRADILRAAALLVAPGGHLLLVTHAEMPPWAEGHDHAPHLLLSPAEEIETLQLPAAEWTTVLAETRTRAATAPDGTPAELVDGVVLLHRRP